MLEAETAQDATNLSALLPLALKVCARRLLNNQLGQEFIPLDEGILRNQIISNHNLGKTQMVTRDIMKAAFTSYTSLDELSKKPLMLPSGHQIIGFDVPTAIVAKDIAPYVRSIVSYDMRLEEQRLRLSDMLSQGGRNGKKPRLTRASRAALEGGSKANTRRERWLPISTNFPLVLRTGGQGWHIGTLQEPTRGWSAEDTGSFDGSRRSSGATAGSEA